MLFALRAIAADGDVSPHVSYACPMHSAVQGEKPGRCAACGMELVPVILTLNASVPTHGPGLGVVRLSTAQQQLLGVQLGRAERGVVARVVRTLGRVAVDQTRDFPVVAGAEGWVVKVFPEATTGATVRAGQPLATVAGREFTTVQRTYLYALRSLAETPQTEMPVDGFQEDRRNVLAEARLDLARLGLSDADVAQIAATHQVALEVTVRAPADGLLLARAATPRRAFLRGEELFRVADLSRVWVVADLFGDDAEHLAPGGAVRVTLPDRPGIALTATVSDAWPEFDAQTRTHKVRLEVDNPELVLRLRMFVDLEFSVALPEAVHVPVDAVVDAGTRSVVFVDRGEGAFEARAVEAGWRAGGRAQIVSGLAAGETIVVSGNFLLDSESRMRMPAAGP